MVVVSHEGEMSGAAIAAAIIAAAITTCSGALVIPTANGLNVIVLEDVYCPRGCIK